MSSNLYLQLPHGFAIKMAQMTQNLGTKRVQNITINSSV